MSDLLPQGALQQAHARSISGEHLEVLGKQAAMKFCSGEAKDLSAAVIETVKHASLSPEQVKRVCEFANTDAYLTEFKKEGAGHKFIDFGSGPANPSDVLKDLNGGGGGTVFDHGADYDRAPGEKHASAEVYVERGLHDMFAAPEVALPLHNPYGEVLELKDKLSAAGDQLGSEIEALELQYADAADKVYQQVKQAALEGVSLGQVVQAWQQVVPSAEYVKVAFNLFTPRLLRDEVFWSVEHLGESLIKTAAPGVVVNEAHPLVLDMGVFCTTLTELAEKRAARSEVREHLGTLTGFLKEASVAEEAGKAVRGAWTGLNKATAHVGEHAGKFVGEATGSPMVGKVVDAGISHSPKVVAALEANALKNKAEQSPTYHRGLSMIPGTDDYSARWGR